jgi:hypothetical protein
MMNKKKKKMIKYILKEYIYVQKFSKNYFIEKIILNIRLFIYAIFFWANPDEQL